MSECTPHSPVESEESVGGRNVACDEGDQVATSVPSMRRMRKSCDFCRQRKRKCDGDGANRCSFCILKGKMQCTYSRRQLYTTRNAQRSVAARKAMAPEVAEKSALKMKRCRFSASPATGLVGFEENELLSDYFRCFSVLPLTRASAIRGAMLRILLSRSPKPARVDGYSAAAGVSPDASVCAFWCAVALGGLLQGRTVQAMSRYIRLAEDALQMCEHERGEDVARAFATMSFVYEFYEKEDGMKACILRAHSIIQELWGREPGVRLDQGLVLFVQTALHREVHEGRCTQIIDVKNTRDEFPKDLPLQVTDLSEEGMFQSCFRFHMKMVNAMREDLALPRSCDSPGREEPVTTCAALAAHLAASDDGNGGSFAASAQGDEAQDVQPPELVWEISLQRFKREHVDEIEHLKRSADGPRIRLGVGGLIANGALAMLYVLIGDIESAARLVYPCVEVVERYPGLCGTHGFHIILVLVTLVLAAVQDHVTYRKLADLYNSMRLEGMPEIAPLERRLETSFCEHLPCRMMERAMRQRRLWSASVSLDVPEGLDETGLHGHEADLHLIPDTDLDSPIVASLLPEPTSVLDPGCEDGTICPVGCEDIDREDWRHAADALCAK